MQQKMLIYVSAFVLYIAQLTGAEKKTSESQQHVQHDVRKTASATEASHE